MSVHYKFKNTINYDAIKFDGVYISAGGLKLQIAQQKKLGHSELQVDNEETGQTYTDDQLIPKNTNIIVSRLPFANSNKRSRLAASAPYPARFNANAAGNASGSLASAANGSGSSNRGGGHHHHHNHNHHHRHNHYHNSNANNSNQNGSGLSRCVGGGNANGVVPTLPAPSSSSLSNSAHAANQREALELVYNNKREMTEEEKIKHIQSQSAKDFDPSRFARGRGGRGPRGGGHFIPGPGYTCKKCGVPGHSIYDCKASTMHKVKRSSGIPRDFLVKVDSKEKGALMTPSGEYVVPLIDREAYSNPKIEKAPFFEDGTPSDQQLSNI